MDDQSSVIAFLGSPQAHGIDGSVDVLDTHGAFVFLAGGYAYKIKRPVHYDYMDFSTLALRREALERELEVNRAGAPELYLDVVPVRRDTAGKLHLGGEDGEIVEWALQMRRFDQADLLSAVVDRGRLTVPLARDLADVVRASHDAAANVVVSDADGRLQKIIDNLVHGLRDVAHLLAPFPVEAFERLAAAQMLRARDCLRRRGTAGAVARCHGDLHLGNIVMWRDRPMLFDALEFDEALATIDKLYDLAFLLMDLDHRGQRGIANVVLNRYLAPVAGAADIHGLVAMPLFLGVRSAIRALVTAQRAILKQPGSRSKDLDAARASSTHALVYLEPPPPRLVAVGGLSGTGKSTLAASLAPDLLPVPGALHIRTDVERKALFGVAETERLPASAYTPEVTERVYAMMLDRARAALEAGHTAIMDAVFARPAEREAAAAIATAAAVEFRGLWLTAPRATMLDRVAARTNDASDATPEVVERQVMYGCTQTGGWLEIEAGGEAAATLAAARAALAI